MTKVEKHYSPEKVAEVLAMSLGRVYRLIREKKLIARKRVAQGKGAKPRLIIAESELRRYLDAMETTAEQAAAGDAPAHAPPAEERRERRHKTGIKGVKNFV